MANLKLDLLNKLKNEKYYSELELIRLAQDPNMVYKEKIDEISNKLIDITLTNSAIGLAEQYFVEQQPEQIEKQNIQAEQNPLTKPYQGQTHSE